MADKIVRVVLTGQDKSASAAFSKVASSGDQMTKKIGGSLTKLGGMIGGEFGDILDKVGSGLDDMGERGKSMGAKFTIGGAALAGAGALLVGLGDKEKAASQQLDQAITNTGANADDFQKQIAATVHEMEKYGDSAVTTKNSLQILTQATHDPTKALSMMGEAADLAAAQHESLDAAATQLSKLLGGKGAKILAQYGIQVKTNADGTKDYAGANVQLAAAIKGQAAAAADTFTGKLKALRTEVEDHIAVFGQKYGPAITGIGTALTAAGSIIQLFAATQARAAAAAATSSEETAVAVESSTISQVGSFAQVGTAAQATSATAIQSDEAAAASTGELADAVAASAAEQLTAFAAVSRGVRATAAATVTANAQMAVSSRATAGSIPLGGGAAGAGAATGLGSIAAKAGIAGAIALAVREGFDQGMASLEKSGGNKAKFADIIGGLGGDPQKGTPTWAKEAGSWGQSLSNPYSTVKKLSGAVMGLFGAHHKNAKAAQEDATAENGVAAQMEQAAAKTAIVKQETADLTTALTNLGQAQIGAMQSQDAFMSSLDSLTQSEKDNGKSLSVNSEKGRANREAFLGAGSAALSYAQAQQKNGVPIATVTKNLAANVLQLERTADKAGFSKSQVQALVHQMGLTPKQISTLFSAITSTANAKLDGYVTKLRSIDGTTVRTFVEVEAIGKGASYGVSGGNHSSGGFAFAGGGVMPYDGVGMVGEEGPERVIKHGSRVEVIPLGKGGRRSGGGHGGDASGGGATVHIYNTFAAGTNLVAAGREIAKQLEPYLAAGGKVKGLS